MVAHCPLPQGDEPALLSIEREFDIVLLGEQASTILRARLDWLDAIKQLATWGFWDWIADRVWAGSNR
jgi:hypothetical protein